MYHLKFKRGSKKQYYAPPSKRPLLQAIDPPYVWSRIVFSKLILYPTGVSFLVGGFLYVVHGLFGLFFILTVAISLPVLLSSYNSGKGRPSGPRVRGPRGSTFRRLGLSSCGCYNSIFNGKKRSFIVAFLAGKLIVNTGNFASNNKSVIIIRVGTTGRASFCPTSNICGITTGPRPNNIRIKFTSSIANAKTIVVCKNSCIHDFSGSNISLNKGYMISNALRIGNSHRGPGVRFAFVVSSRSRVSCYFGNGVSRIVR